MLIEDLKTDSTVTIYVTDGERAVQLSSSILSLNNEDAQICLKEAKALGYNSFLAVKAITSGDYIVSFLSENITCCVTAVQNKKPYSWEHVKIIHLNLSSQGNVHVILSNDNVQTFNRRNEYRVFLGYTGNCSFEGSDKSISVMIKDVSCSGIGMIYDKNDDIELHAGMRVKIQFVEVEDDGSRKKYTLDGKIIRYVSMNNTKKLIGCKLISNNTELEKLIYKKQRQIMSVGHKPQVKREMTRTVAKELAALAGQLQDD